MLLRIEDLNVYYGRIHAAKGIAFDVDEGEIVAIMGSNGAGKSTTVRSLCGLVRPRAGKITFGGVDITRVGPERVVRLGIGYVPEGRRVFGQMSVAENLLVGAYSRRDRATLNSDLDAVYALFPILAERRSQFAAGLSGGEQQMLALGRALMTRPRLLVLDEPSLGLAPIIVDQVFALLRRLNADDGLSILLVEQNAHAALRLAHRAMVLETGTVRLRGSAAELRDDPLVREVYLGQ
jgi:branched-chain amino acid transport system ATP-binding protein